MLIDAYVSLAIEALYANQVIIEYHISSFHVVTRPKLSLLLKNILFAIEINECASEPCQNGATCMDDINGYLCRCKEGYAGDQCELGNHNISNIIT